MRLIMNAHARYPEIDILRGIAIVLMIIYHLAYNLHQAIGIVFLNTDSYFLFKLGIFAALTFFIVFGISAVPAAEKYDHDFFWKCFRRGAILLFFAFIITGVSYVIPIMDPIWFGVLHFLGVSSLLLPFFVRISPSWLLILSGLTLCIGFFFNRIILSVPYFLPFGIRYQHFTSSDYYPLLPWLFAILFGVWCGKMLYSNKSPSPLKNLPFPLSALSILGRHALLIYLIHQPIIYGILLLIVLS